MRKTSVYLDDDESRRLARLARSEGVSQAAIIRKAISNYEPASAADRDFAMARSGEGPGGSIADVAEEDLLDGFGD